MAGDATDSPGPEPAAVAVDVARLVARAMGGQGVVIVIVLPGEKAAKDDG